MPHSHPPSTTVLILSLVVSLAPAARPAVAQTMSSHDVDARPASRAIGRGDKAEILAFPNGGHFDIITPGTKAWAEVEGFILGHAFGEAAHTP